MKIFLPIIIYVFTSVGQEAAFLWLMDINNQRPQMIENQSLTEAAQWHAEYIEANDYFSHCTKEGDCPNRIIKRFNCNHPYNENGNAVESLVRGTADARVAYNALINSPSHSQHLHGLNEMTRKQIYYGVGFSGTTFVFLSSESC